MSPLTIPPIIKPRKVAPKKRTKKKPPVLTLLGQLKKKIVARISKISGNGLHFLGGGGFSSSYNIIFSPTFRNLTGGFPPSDESFGDKKHFSRQTFSFFLCFFSFSQRDRVVRAFFLSYRSMNHPAKKTFSSKLPPQFSLKLPIFSLGFLIFSHRDRVVRAFFLPYWSMNHPASKNFFRQTIFFRKNEKWA